MELKSTKKRWHCLKRLEIHLELLKSLVGMSCTGIIREIKSYENMIINSKKTLLNKVLNIEVNQVLI